MPCDPSAPSACCAQPLPAKAENTACGGCGDTPASTASATATAKNIPSGYVVSRLHIAQMDCPVEERMIRDQAATLPFVAALEFNLLQRRLQVVHKAGTLPAIKAAISSLGMTAEEESSGEQATPTRSKMRYALLAFAGLAALAAEISHWIGLDESVQITLALLAIAACGLNVYRKGWIALRHGQLNINALMTIAASGAMLIGQWPEAAMVLFLFTVAELIEQKSLERARNAVQSLLALSPERATVLQADGSWQEQEAADIAPGARLRVKPGERIALDGIVLSGHSSVNQAAITGESLPVEKTAGDSVFAGTLNEAGALEYETSATASDSLLARIIDAIENAQAKRAPIQRLVDRFAQIYTPAVVAIAFAIALVPPLLFAAAWQEWLYKALVLLVIACPCALVISTPVTIVSALAAAARAGILVKGGAWLEAGHKLRWLALDKTGTLTRGQPELTDSIALGEHSAASAFHLAASLAAHSSHPLSRALVRAWQAQAAAAPLHKVAQFSEQPGCGLQATINGQHYQLGNRRLIDRHDTATPALDQRLDALQKEGKTTILLSDGKSMLALFALADTVKENSREAIAKLHALGIQTALLSGDNQHTARAVAARVGIDSAHGDLMAEDKLRLVSEQAAHGVVGMVGDGINDAPALAGADIGFAMAASGSDAAIETADVALMDDDPNKIVTFVRLSRRTGAVLKQNIALALGLKAVFLALTLVGLSTMWMAVFADMGTSLLVVANGLRLLRARV